MNAPEGAFFIFKFEFELISVINELSFKNISYFRSLILT